MGTDSSYLLKLHNKTALANSGGCGGFLACCRDHVSGSGQLCCFPLLPTV